MALGQAFHPPDNNPAFHPPDNNPAIIRKVDKDFVREFNFKDMKFSIKIRDIHKIEKRIVTKLVFLVIKRKKNIQSMCQKIFSRDMLI